MKKQLDFSKSSQLKKNGINLLKPKKIKLSKIKKELLDLVKQQVRIRDNYTCQKCGKKVEGSNCHVSHVIPVSHGNRLAFEPLNMKILCYHDHLNWWHKNPLEAAAWFASQFPERHAFLEAHKNEEVHWKAFDYEEKIRLLKEASV